MKTYYVFDGALTMHTKEADNVVVTETGDLVGYQLGQDDGAAAQGLWAIAKGFWSSFYDAAAVGGKIVNVVPKRAEC